MFWRTAFLLISLHSVSAIAEDEPKWLRDARAREGKSLKPVEIKSKDGWFKVRTPGKLVNSVDKVERSYSIELDVGGDARVYCEVFPEGIDLGNALRLTLDNAIKDIEASQGKIEFRGLEHSDAGAHGPVPYIQLSWLYRVTAPDGARLGAFKQFVMEKGAHGVYCSHNDLGFTRTFDAITRAFAETLETQEAAAAPYYVEIASASMSGVKIGVLALTLERDSDGDTRARQLTSMLIATEDGVVTSQDSTHINWIRPDGSLINAANTSVANGELESNLGLKPYGDWWLVEGEIQGKAVKTKLPDGSQPGNWVAQARELRALMSNPDAVGREHTMGIWVAEDPEKLTIAKTKLLARQGDDRFTAHGEFGSVIADLVLEKSTGMTPVADLKIGPITFRMERVFASGSF
jgi:hypothetical protein